jgi:hypothetical protein
MDRSNSIVKVYDVEVDQNHDILNQGTIEIVKAYYDALDRANHTNRDTEVQLVVPIKSNYYIAGISRIMQIICIAVGLIIVWDYLRISR